MHSIADVVSRIQDLQVRSGEVDRHPNNGGERHDADIAVPHGVFWERVETGDQAVPSPPYWMFYLDLRRYLVLM